MCGDEVENKHSCTLNTLTSFEIRSNLASYVWHRPLVFSCFLGGGGQGGQKIASLSLCHFAKLVLLPFVAISVHSCWRDLRNKQEAGMLSSSSTLLKFSLFATFHVANSGHQTLKYIGESDCCLAYLIFSSTSAQQPVLFATDKDDYCSFEWCGYLDTTTSPRICCKLANVLWRQGSPWISDSILGEDNHGTMGCAPTISLGCLTLFFGIKYRQKLTSRMWKKHHLRFDRNSKRLETRWPQI